MAILWFGWPLINEMLSSPPAEFDYLPPPPDHHLPPPPPPPTTEESSIWHTRRDEVREAFRHSWTGYKTKAFPSDELLPVTGGKSDK